MVDNEQLPPPSKLDPMIVEDFIDWIQDCVNQAAEEYHEACLDEFEIELTMEDHDELYRAYFWSMAKWFLKDMSAYEFAELKSKGFDHGRIQTSQE